MFIGQITYNPFGDHQLVCRIFGIDRQEFYFILFIYHAIQGKITYFGMSIFYLSACLCNVGHALSTEIIELGIWC